MARYISTYTLDGDTIAAVGRLVEDGTRGESLRVLMPTLVTLDSKPQDVPAAPPLVDERGLCAQDYITLYALIDVSLDPKPAWVVKGKPIMQPAPELTWTDFHKHYRNKWYADTPASNAKSTEVQLLIKSLKKMNEDATRACIKMLARGAQQSPPKPRRAVSASRIVDALINLGLETLKERVASLNVDVARSKSEDAGEGQNKLSHNKRRKAITV